MMKQSLSQCSLLLVTLSLLLTACSPTIQTYTYDDVREENGLYVDTETNEPITGEINSMDSSFIKQRYSYKAGKLHGVLRDYYNSGQLKSLSTYKDGIPHGLSQIFYESGLLRSENTHLAGELDGEIRNYYDTGVLKSSHPFSNGIAHGVWREYYESGTLESEEPFQNDELQGTVTYYHESGTISMVATYVNGHEHGTTRHYSESGYLEREESYEHGKQNGPDKVYFKSGALKAEFYYRSGKFSGKWTKYFETGGIRRQFVFDPDLKHRQSFTFKTFYRSGNIRSEGTVTVGQLLESRKFHESGELAVEAMFDDGNLIDIHGPTSKNRSTLLQFFNQPNCNIKPGKRGFYPSGELHCEVVANGDQQMVLREYLEYGPVEKEVIYKNDIAISGYYQNDDGVKQTISDEALQEMNDECEYYRW